MVYVILTLFHGGTMVSGILSGSSAMETRALTATCSNVKKKGKDAPGNAGTVKEYP